MKEVCSVSNMRESDAYAVAHSVSGRELMQRAGRGVFESCDFSGKTAIVCGSGNNAGDGYVIALLMKENSLQCRLFLLSERFSDDGKYYFDKCVRAGVEYELADENTDFSQYDTIIDCVFGTGFKGTVGDFAADVIDKINACGKRVVSVDINSGLDGDSGLSEKCVRSDLTVSIGTYKAGHFLGQAKDKIGRLKNVDIGIKLRQKPYFLLEDTDFADIFKKRENNSNKGTYGYVGILGGCTEYSGAVKLANMGACAMRAGCGVTRLIIPKSISDGVLPYALESTLCPVRDRDGHMLYDENELSAAVSKLSALAVGMGWGKTDDNAKILEYLIKNFDKPLVIDADGLNTLSALDKTLLRETEGKVVLTPHPKEFERLSGIPVKEVLASPISCAESFAKENGVILLLKGASTIVTDGEDTYISDRGCAGMATAGSGDVLSGVIIGMLGYSECTAKTIASAAYVAGLAGETACRKGNEISMTASDTAGCVKDAVTELIKRSCAL